MKSLDGILSLADYELSSMVDNGKFRSREDVDTAYKLIDIIKDVHCIWDYEDKGYSGNDYRGRSYRSGMRSYEDRRDRYSRGSKREYIEELRSMMADAPDEQTRQSIQRMISQMEM